MADLQARGEVGGHPSEGAVDKTVLHGAADAQDMYNLSEVSMHAIYVYSTLHTLAFDSFSVLAISKILKSK